MTEPTEDPKPDRPTINISAPGYLFPTMFLWAVVAPCTMAVCRYTIAPDLTWWDVTMPLWGVPAAVVGVVAAFIGMFVGAVLLAVAAIAAVAPPIYLWAWLRDRCLTVWGWSESWRASRNEARIILDHKKIAEGITNRIKQSFASIGACDTVLKCNNIETCVEACISAQLIGGSKFTYACSWSLLEAEGKPASFFRQKIVSIILAVRKSRDEDEEKAKS
jgi:hypothetical protein